MENINRTDAEWREQLTEEQYRICRCSDTEAPFTGLYWDCKDEGLYRCVCCGNALFDSSAKFDSGTGWPSFSQPHDPKHLQAREDSSHGLQRVEVCCKRCGAHLGHIFPDGPAPTGLRFCINSAALALDRV